MDRSQTTENPIGGEQEIKFFKRENYPDLGEGFGILGYLILFSIVFGLLNYIPKSFLKNPTEELSSLLDLVGYIASFLIVIFIIFKKINKAEFWDSLKLSKIKPILFLMVIPISLATSFITEPLISWLPMPDFMVEVFKNLIKFNVFSISMIVICAPILEEVVFRGIILKGFLKNYSPAKAIIWSAVLFGIVHLNPWQFIGATSIGLVMGWLYWKTGSVIPGIILHFLNNLGSTIAFYYLGNIELTSREWINNDNVYFSIYLGAIIILVLSFIYVKKLYSKKD